jgi:iron complex transport system ATP-binding protein
LDYINPETLGVVLTERIDTMGLRVHEIIALGRHPYTGYFGTLSQEDKDIVHEAMTLTKTEEFANRLFSSLSDGERQKVMIAKALAQETPIILMDEPSAFLDFPSKVALMQMLNYLAHEKQKSILLSTHDIGIALRTADVLWLMQNGELCIGKPEELMLEGKIGNFLGESIKYI